MATAWVTAEEVLAAKAALEEAMPDWEAPEAYALGVAVGEGSIQWRVINYPNIHQLPAVVLGTVLGYRNGSATYRLNADEFDEAIRLLEPAGACDAFEHPNLWAWQQLRSDLRDGTVPADSSVVVVFLGGEVGGSEDSAQVQLRETLERTD